MVNAHTIDVYLCSLLGGKMYDVSKIKIQNKLLVMLEKVITIANQHNITVFIGYGTLLGAVRHKGFIPWDDDIDLLVPRQDIKRFYGLLRDQLPKEYSVNRNPRSGHYAKVFDENTTFVRENNKIGGIFIDLWSLDGLSNSPRIANLILSFNHLLKFIRKLKEKRPSRNKLIYLMRFIIRIFLVLVPNKIIYNLHIMSLSVFSYYKSNFVGNILGVYKEKELLTKDIFREGSHYPFCNYNLLGPKNYDVYLTRFYSDYKSPPPIEERIGHSPVFVSLNKSYKHYQS